jgi:hypothetical protein
MRKLSSLSKPNFVTSLGDNFYEKGPDNARKIETVWRDVFIQGSMSDIVWHQVLGNEDWFGDINLADAQVEYTSSQDSMWHLPDFFYSHSLDLGEHGTATFIHIDTSKCQAFV